MNTKPMGIKANVRVQHVDACRQRIDVAFAWWVARTFPKLRVRAERYAIKRHRIGRILSDDTMHNIVVTAGVTGQANHFLGLASEDAFVYQAVGTSSTAEAAGQTGLIAETAASGLARKTADAKSVINIGADTATSRLGPTLFVNNTAGTITLEEAGIFNGHGTMFARFLSGTKELLPGQGVIATHDITWTYTP